MWSGAEPPEVEWFLLSDKSCDDCYFCISVLIKFFMLMAGHFSEKNFISRWRCCSGITISLYLFARWHLFRHDGYLRYQQQVHLWPFDLETGVRVTCDVGYLCANFSLPRPVCSRIKPRCTWQTDIRQTSVKEKNRLMPLSLGQSHKTVVICQCLTAL